MNRVFDFIMNSDEDSKLMFANDIETLILDSYFNKYWKDDSMSFPLSGHDLALRVNQLRPESVLDVGCGNNNFSDLIYNHVGLDPFNAKADIKMPLLQYEKENADKQYDVILALDSMNFGKRPLVLHHFDAIDRMTKTGGHQFWRVNIDGPIEHPEFPLLGLIDFYEWNEKFIRELADYKGYEVRDLEEETNSSGERRLFFCFYKY